MSLAEKVARNYLFGIAAYLTIFLSTRVSSIILARHLGEEMSGIFQFHYGNAFLFMLVVSAPFTLTNISFVSAAEGEGKPEEGWALLRLSLGLVGSAALGLSLFCALRPEWLAGVFARPEVYGPSLPWMALALVPMALNYQFAAGAQGRHWWARMSLTNMVSLGIWMLLNVGVWLAGGGLREYFIAFAAQGAIATACYLGFYRRDLLRGGSAPWPKVRAYARFGTSAALMTVAEIVLWQRSIENLILERHVLPEELGFYAIGYNTAQALMTIVPGIFWAVLYPVFSEQAATASPEEMQRLFRTSSKMLALLAVPLACVAMAAARPGIVAMFGEGFAPAATIFALSALGTMLYSMKMGLSSFLLSSRRPLPVALMSLVMSALMAGAMLWAIPRHGILGAAVAKTTVLALAAVAELALLTRLSHVRYPLAEVGRVLAASALAGGLLWLLGREVMGPGGFWPSLGATLAIGGLAPVATWMALGLTRALSAGDLAIVERLGGKLPEGLQGWLRRLLAVTPVGGPA